MPVLMHQSLAVPSLEPVRTETPSPEKTADQQDASGKLCVQILVSMLQTFGVLSKPHVNTEALSPENIAKGLREQ